MTSFVLLAEALLHNEYMLVPVGRWSLWRSFGIRRNWQNREIRSDQTIAESVQYLELLGLRLQLRQQRELLAYLVSSVPRQLIDFLGMADQSSLLEAGEHAPWDVVGGEAAPLDMGGEQGEGAGLSGSGAQGGGIGQGAAAGIGPILPAAPADPAMMALLQ